ncbi:hypothetical protein [Fructilactobacillus fructivorans]|uniref:Uncharacterized protein n=1 Tax=Fructilactobacillus fructivorans TaxID=1614 RepID=A0AAE6P1V0_9LACO|nr:hypothetical protein [Fructilactobacillus fructivorans]KRK56930.1 hypothetical protein FC73_GL001324 [Fructilactobacillus fructivorans]KRN13210.1 hypothetical protein IV37_GL000852 [Fructilactobacillus fructivorans]KRN41205.1 hypothetical protein IV51_GL000523 [Fructilactobacillus fructivorans]KRN43020.1 hypothetical protein IV48_GL000826 [Fructilactobacillus fructivorans]QFX93219.1 hypothetical protein LF543_06570 [Fructilactobacillus fructivorans]
MSETIFFNPGDSLGNFHDYNDAVRSAQLYRDKQIESKNVVVVHGKDKKSFDIFLSDNAQSNDKNNDQTSPYYVNKRI